MYPNEKLAKDVRKLMAKVPASKENRRMGAGGKWSPHLSQREADIIYAALCHHHTYAFTGHHEDADVGDVVRRMAARTFRNTAEDRQLDDEEDIFNPYAHLMHNPKLLKFIKDMDLHTLEEVIVRVMSDLWRRRAKYLGGDKEMAKDRE